MELITGGENDLTHICNRVKMLPVTKRWWVNVKNIVDPHLFILLFYYLYTLK